MQLIYTTQTTGFEPHKHYRNPLYFEKAESKVTDVVIYGDFPKIAQAYQSLGVKVQWVDEQSDKKPLDKMTVPELTTALKALNVEIPQGAKKDELIALLKQAKGGDNDPERTNG
ncbi:HeH/LEM domain-containing protein [Glaesserella parasuis]|uniref:HeH/LEM domain-containing protein n=1 Tax=Glaesserella parasuis ZJ0906 TaxID=1322346 RepID=A0A806J2B5_GLAPU|nr:HeH/LEM domain-containing protein [Glaesserella parasuis]AGO16017.1 hypothetical protein K756_04010 [Glaesserella parasuis ZJ0906]AMW17144.1 hypothetical protein A4U84_08010 [Glaesserella parasuis]ATW45523.1 hypothetical protein A2U21_06070 [Glaesserella parasuis str. Nagasaki]EQA10002.1 hypothetical protein HPS8415995_0593 [Glaesserella parasuis 84-15995]EYE72642.1 hypothetical protein HPNK_03303 [Glaesserella parasuis str. Nagasaki]